MSTIARYPLFQATGTDSPPLSKEQAIAATRDERIASVKWFAIRQINSFARTMKAREIANFDQEDIWLEMYILLASKDHLWNPETSSYLTFAGMLIAHELEEIRCKSRTVESPRNASLRLKSYATARANGELSPRASLTEQAIRRTIADPEQGYLEGERTADAHLPGRVPSPDTLVSGTEEAKNNRSTSLLALRKLSSPQAITMICMFCGLGHCEPLSIDQIAKRMGIRYRDAKRIINEGLAELRTILEGECTGV